MVITNNMQSMNAFRNTNITNKKLQKSAQRLSTGYQINSSADNAAGLSISEKMRAQIRGLNQSSSNIQDGISFLQTADGALNEMQALIQRGRELCVQASNDSNVEADRTAIQEEFNQIRDEINRLSEQSEFNTINCFPSGGSTPSKAPNPNVSSYQILVNRSDGSTLISASSSNVTNIIGDKIATELVPNALNQILTAFPSLDNGDRDIALGLQVANIDGSFGILAYAQISYAPSNGDIYTFTLKIDSSDFSDSDTSPTGIGAELLESTIAHEMMHHVMYNVLTDGMTDYGPETFPQWFVEGTAQVAGGGFTTGWNSTLSLIEKNTTLAESQKDSAVTNYLKSYTLNGRPYGHGYLASSYLGQLASGSTTVSAENISTGLDHIFSSMLSGSSLEDAIIANTDFNSLAEVQSAFSSPSADLVDFVRSLAAADGAGSAIAASLSTKGSDILNNTTGIQTMFKITGSILIQPSTSADTLKSLHIQIGANRSQSVSMELFDMSAGILGLNSLVLTDHLSATNAISNCDSALEDISGVRSYYGALQNRLEHAITNSDNMAENLQSSESILRDTDMADEMVEYSKYNILIQAGQAMMAQANKSSQGMLTLLQ